jgi:hypothetical protein
MFNFIKRLFKKKESFRIDVEADNIPVAFGYQEEQYKDLVDELTNIIDVNDRLISFDNYLRTPYFEKFELNLEDPNHAALLGYAFCAAVILQRTKQTTSAAQEVLKAFYPDKLIN